MDGDNLTERLISLGLSEREAKVYLALLHKGSATAADLQKTSGIPQTKVYEIIRRLVRQGYCRERRAGHKRTFEVIDPQTALAFPIQKLEERIKDAEALKQELAAVFASAGESFEPVEYIEILHGKENIHRHYCRLVHSAQKEILGFGRPPYACDTDSKIEEQALENEALVARGGVSRWVYELDHGRIPPLADFFAERGEEIRVIDQLPLKMMIFDSREVLVAQEDPYAPRVELTMAIIKQSIIANAYRALFNFFWNQAEELEKWKARHKTKR